MNKYPSHAFKICLVGLTSAVSPQRCFLGCKTRRLGHHTEIIESKLGKGNEGTESMESEAEGYEVSSDSCVEFHLLTFQVDSLALKTVFQNSFSKLFFCLFCKFFHQSSSPPSSPTFTKSYREYNSIVLLNQR